CVIILRNADFYEYTNEEKTATITTCNAIVNPCKQLLTSKKMNEPIIIESSIINRSRFGLFIVLYVMVFTAATVYLAFAFDSIWVADVTLALMFIILFVLEKRIRNLFSERAVLSLFPGYFSL